ncbi:MAG: DUF3800 domain-containing protein [Legionellales bacterium]|nr:DUF3800 domain-containing protein [Legionellales bacterium]
MKLIYIDESGNTGTRSDDINQPYHLLSALIVDDNQVHSIENDLRMLGIKHFGAVSRNTDFEFHGYEIHKGKGRYFSKLKIEQRIDVINDLINVIKTNNLQIIYTIIDKQKSNAKLHPHQLAFLFLIERIEDYLDNENSLGLLIADENRDIEQRLIDDLERFKTIDTGFGYRPTKANHIVDSIHFVKSYNNHLIQLVDIVAYLLLREKRVIEELSKTYKEQSSGCAEVYPPQEWVDKNASKRQKIELEHANLLTKQIVARKEFP